MEVVVLLLSRMMTREEMKKMKTKGIDVVAQRRGSEA